MNAPIRFRQETNPDHSHFFVSAIHGGRAYLLAGPYPTHTDALERVDTVRAEAAVRDTSGKAAFAAFGTSSSSIPHETKLGAM